MRVKPIRSKSLDEVYWPQPEDLQGHFWSIKVGNTIAVQHATRDNIRPRLAKVLGVDQSDLETYDPYKVDASS